MSLAEIVNNPKVRPIAIAFALIAVLGAGWFLFSALLGKSEIAANSTNRVFICSETGKTFSYTLAVGDMEPVDSPYSKKKTGYEAEPCYWTADGKAKTEPTYVLLNQKVGKPGPTFCPDCKRLVVPLNPPAAQGGKPPPTEQEYKQRGGNNR